MGKLIRKFRDWFEDHLRRICGGINPKRRATVIAVIIVLFAVINIWVTFRAIYSIGRESDRYELIRLPSFDDIIEDDADGEPTELQLEIEDFFNKHFNTDSDDTTNE